MVCWQSVRPLLLSQHGECLVGLLAKHQAIVNLANTMFAFKHLTGRQFEDKEVRDNQKHWPTLFSHAVITVPVYFNNTQWEATKDAGQIANHDVLHVINEPTAATLAYSLDCADSSVIAIYDLSSGTFNISMLKMQKGVFKVKVTHILVAKTLVSSSLTIS